MRKLSSFHFYSFSKLDGEINEIKFVAKGYKKDEAGTITWYFKDENEYKFIIKKDSLEVFVNQSSYKFSNNKKTEALLKVDNYLYKASIDTNKLVIDDNKIVIEYILDFVNFKGEYKIIVESY